MLTPTQVAKLANINPNSVRNYSSTYAEFLSPDARGENGPRIYSAADVEIICTIAALRNSGVPPAEVIERIRNQDVPPIVDAEPATPSLQEPPRSLQTTQEPSTALQAIQSSIQARLDAVERRHEADVARLERQRLEDVERAEKQQRRDADLLITGIVLGVLASLVGAALLRWL